MSQVPSESPVVPPTAPTIAPSCPACGYSLRALESERCPECGLALTAEMRVASAIPWEHRRTIGAWRAYWGTVSLVMFRPREFYAALERPVAYRAARGFWLRTVAGTSLLLIFAALALIDAIFRSVIPSGPVTLTLLVGFLASLPISVLLGTGAFTYDCHPPVRSIAEQNRAIGLGYYQSAAMWVFSAAMLLASLTLWATRDATGPTIVGVLIFATIAIWGIGFPAHRASSLIVFLRHGQRTWPPGSGRYAGTGMFVAMLMPLLVPLLLIYFSTIASSLA